jgi:hypothetical protein
VTQQAVGTIWVGTAVAPAPNNFQALGSNLVITESGPAQFGVGTTLTLIAPAGWAFDAATPPSVSGTNSLAATAAAAAGVYTITFTTASTGGAGVLTVSNIRVAATGAGSASADILSGGTTPQIAAGTVLGHIDPTNTRIGIAATPDATVSSDGTDSATLTFTVLGATNNPLAGILVSVTTSRGTLSATSNTTVSSACATGAAGTCTLTFRGNGSTGTAQITATTASPNEAVATFNVTVGSANTTPTAVKHFSTNNSGHVAASAQNVYTSPTVGSRVRFQVTGGSGDGVNGELIQVTVDKGYVVQGDSSGNPTAGNQPGGCTGNNTTASDTSHGPVTIDGTDYQGIVEFTVCARAGQVGPIKVTAKNLSTTMADGTTTLTSAGVPSQLTVTSTGGAISVVVKDKDGNEAADGTVVNAVAPAFSGAVSPNCTTTTNGKAGFAAAASGTSVQVIITVFINDSGDGSAGTCANLPSTVAASTTQNIGPGGTTTPGGGTGGGFTGTAPARGSIGLLVTNQPSTAAGLVSALAAAGCTVESLAVLESGIWKIYINGAPAVVNAQFPGTVATTVAFFVRCAA